MLRRRRARIFIFHKAIDLHYDPVKKEVLLDTNRYIKGYVEFKSNWKLKDLEKFAHGHMFWQPAQKGHTDYYAKEYSNHTM